MAQSISGVRATAAAEHLAAAKAAKAETSELRSELAVSNQALEDMAKEKTATDEARRKAESDRKDVRAKLLTLQHDKEDAVRKMQQSSMLQRWTFRKLRPGPAEGTSTATQGTMRGMGEEGSALVQQTGALLHTEAGSKRRMERKAEKMRTTSGRRRRPHRSVKEERSRRAPRGTTATHRAD